MKKIDLKILSELRINSRCSLTEMGKRINVPISTIFERLKSLNESIIIKNTALINFTKVGYTVKAIILYKIDMEQRESLIKKLKYNDNVNNLYRISNNYNIMCETLFKNILDLEDFNYKIEKEFKIKKKEIMYILENVKNEDFKIME